MASATTESAAVTAPTREQLLKRGSVAVVAAMVAVAVVRTVAVSLGVPETADPMQLDPILTSSVVGAVGATVVYGVLTRVASRPNRTFVVIAGLVLLVSLVPVVTVAPGLPGVTGAVLVTLAAMHLAVAAVSVLILTR
ncbi:DUF6069 family protein [Halorussus halophilus]|uniref:DUF6069 family protein n=1 Tax=Halorussus halophilus TaxID=2650975 RepID=UPI001300E091|nr:DUF6069 family protein [Halorussus halophilus]